MGAKAGSGDLEKSNDFFFWLVLLFRIYFAKLKVGDTKNSLF